MSEMRAVDAFREDGRTNVDATKILKQREPVDIYDKMLQELEKFYGETPNRRCWMWALKSTFAPIDCEVWLMFPTHDMQPASLEEIRKKANGKIPNIDEIFEKLFKTFFIDIWKQEDGVDYYVRNYMFVIALCYNKSKTIPVTSPLSIATGDWWNAMILGCTKGMPYKHGEFRVVAKEDSIEKSISMNMEVPDMREVVPIDYITHMLRERRTICLTTCFCRLTKDQQGTRQCDYPLDVCMIFDDFAEKNLSFGIGKQISVEEAIALTLKGEEMGLVHCISNADEPTVLCQCCSCCCLVLNSLSRGENMCGKPSRFILKPDDEQCNGCGECVQACPADALRVVKGTLLHDVDKCIGCGLCVGHCEKKALSMSLRSNAGQMLPDFKHIDVAYI